MNRSIIFRSAFRLAIVPLVASGATFSERVLVKKAEKTEVMAEFASAPPIAGETRNDNALGLDLVYCPPGSFTMGSPESEEDRSSDEKQVRVTLSQGFWLGQYEVTQEEWKSVMGTEPSHFKGFRRPVERVSWEDVVEFCRRLTDRERKAGRLGSNEAYQLPTEAQWEYACRAGTATAFAFGDTLDSTQANFDGDYPYGGASKGPYLGATSAVGDYCPNAWGLYDMHGNVREWTADYYNEALAGGADPKGPSSGIGRVDRGGSWSYFASSCRSAYRRWDSAPGRFARLGFRVARVSFL